MATSGTVVGKSGSVKFGSSYLAEVTKWTLTPKVTISKYFSGDSQGCERARSGGRMCSGTVEGKLDMNDPIWDHINEGDYVALELAFVKGGPKYTVNAVVENGPDVTVENGKEAFGWTFSWTSDGPWTRPDGSSSAQT